MGQYCSCAQKPGSFFRSFNILNKIVNYFRNLFTRNIILIDKRGEKSKGISSVPITIKKEKWRNMSFEANLNNHAWNSFNNNHVLVDDMSKNTINQNIFSKNIEPNSKFSTLNSSSNYFFADTSFDNCQRSGACSNADLFVSKQLSTLPISNQHKINKTQSQNDFICDSNPNFDYNSIGKYSSYSSSQLEFEIQLFNKQNSQKIVALLEQVLDYLVTEIDVIYIESYVKKMKNFSIITLGNDEVRNILWDILTGQDGEDFGLFCELLNDDDHHKGIVELLLCLECLVSLVSSYPHFSQITCEHKNRGSVKSSFDINLITTSSHKSLTSSVSSSMSLYSLDTNLLNGSTYLVQKKRFSFQVALDLAHFCFCSLQQLNRLKQALSDFSNFVKLNFSFCCFTEDTFNSFTDALASNRSLQKLSFHSTLIPESNFEKFCDTLCKIRSTLKSFSFTNLIIPPSKLNLLIGTLSSQTYIQDLDLSKVILDVELVTTLAGFVSTSKSLKSLIIKNTNLNLTSFKPFAFSLSQNSTLKMLDISNNNLQDSSITSLSQSIILNSSIHSINLTSCSLTHVGATALSRSLKANYSLQQIILSNNPLSNSGMVVLASGLCYNQSLLHFELDSCGIGNKGFFHLLKALKHHRKIQVIKLCYNQIGSACDVDDTEKYVASDISLDKKKEEINVEELFKLLKEVLHMTPRLKIFLKGNPISQFMFISA